VREWILKSRKLNFRSDILALLSTHAPKYSLLRRNSHYHPLWSEIPCLHSPSHLCRNFGHVTCIFSDDLLRAVFLMTNLLIFWRNCVVHTVIDSIIPPRAKGRVAGIIKLPDKIQIWCPFGERSIQRSRIWRRRIINSCDSGWSKLHGTSSTKLLYRSRNLSRSSHQASRCPPFSRLSPDRFMSSPSPLF